jgi:adenylate cyclase
MRRLLLHIVILGFALTAVAQADKDSTLVYRLIAESEAAQSPAKALYLARQADSVAENQHMHVQIDAGKNLLILELQSGESYNGLRTFLQLNNLLEKNEKWEDVVYNYFSLGDYYAQNGMYSSAVEKHLEGAVIAKRQQVDIDRWQNRMRIADLKAMIPDYTSALDYYNEAFEILEAELLVDTASAIKTYRKMALMHNKLGRFEEAIEENEAVLELLEGQKNPDAYISQLNNIGFAYHRLGKSQKALEYFLETLNEREKRGFKDDDNVSFLINMGIAYQTLNNAELSRVYLHRAAKSAKDLEQLAEINDLLAMAYLVDEEVLQAQEFNKKGLAQAKRAKNPNLEAEARYTSSIINEKLLQYAEALDDFKIYLAIKDSLDIADRQKQQELLKAEYAIERTQGEIQSLIASNEIKDYQIEQLRLESENSQKALALQQANAKAQLQALQLERTKLEAEKSEQEVATLKAKEENQRLQLERQQLQEEKAKQALLIAEEKNKVQDLELEKQKAASRNLSIILLLSSVLLILIVYALWRTNKARKELSESRDIIRQERDRSDNLLLNILPESTANELKEYGRAAPKKFNSASVFFSDFKSFSSLSQDYTPEDLIETLEEFFGGFDKVIAKYEIEKIKTIGDAYMCASGIPKEQPDHALRMVRAAMEMLEVAHELNKKQIANGREPWYLRIGINSGPVIAGVVGSKKFIYDVWGDAVNLASR